jgi:hypothetical protein
MSAESQPIDHLAPMGLAMTKLISISSTIMNVLLNCLRLAVILLPLATLGGCAFLQPVTETVVHAVVTQFPGSFDKLEARLRCWEHTSEVHGQKTEAERTEALNQEVDDYRALVEASLVYRAETVRLIERLRSSIEMRQPFSGEDLLELNEGLAEHLDLRKRLYQVAEAHECWLNPKGLVAEMTPAQRLKGIMISLSAALVLYDNYLFAISLYQEEPRLRLLLNNKDVGYEIDYGELNRISLSFASEGNPQPGASRHRLLRGGDRGTPPPACGRPAPAVPRSGHHPEPVLQHDEEFLAPWATWGTRSISTFRSPSSPWFV